MIIQAEFERNERGKEREDVMLPEFYQLRKLLGFWTWIKVMGTRRNPHYVAATWSYTTFDDAVAAAMNFKR